MKITIETDDGNQSTVIKVAYADGYKSPKFWDTLYEAIKDDMERTRGIEEHQDRAALS